MDKFAQKVRNSIKPLDVDTYTLIAEPKGLYGADLNDDLYPIPITAILQLENGKVEVGTVEHGVTSFSFDFVGSLDELEKFKKAQACTIKSS
jgi:hypothetical protein